MARCAGGRGSRRADCKKKRTLVHGSTGASPSRRRCRESLMPAGGKLSRTPFERRMIPEGKFGRARLPPSRLQKNRTLVLGSAGASPSRRRCAGNANAVSPQGPMERNSSIDVVNRLSRSTKCGRARLPPSRLQKTPITNARFGRSLTLPAPMCRKRQCRESPRADGEELFDRRCAQVES